LFFILTKKLLASIAFFLLTTPSLLFAQQTYPYSCKWISEVTPDAEIRFENTNGIGRYSGELLYKGRRLMSLDEGQFQGYGSNWWSENGNPGKPLVVFSGNQVVRGTLGFQAQGTTRVLLVGLGSALYYGRDNRWRQDSTLLTAGEGFWRSSSGCRSLGGR